MSLSVRQLSARLPTVGRLRARCASRRAAALHRAPSASASVDDDMAAPKPRFTPTEFVVDKTDAFASLQLRTIADEVGGVRVRQHVNPLSSRNMALVPPPPWRELFADATLPLVLDLGCGSGRFLLSLGERDAARTRNYLGIEIREPLVTRANTWAEKKGWGGYIRFGATNANVNAQGWLDAYPGPLQQVSILHPDPHWKKKHQKRRIVQPALARMLAERLAPGGVIFLQSDVKAVAEDMVSVFESAAGADLLELAPVHFGPGASADWPPPEAAQVNQGNNLQRDASRAAAVAKARAEAAASRKRPREGAPADGAADAATAVVDEDDDDDDAAEGCDDDNYDPFAPKGWAKLPGNGWLRENPVGVPTERELGTVAAGGHCWRALLLRKDAPAAAAAAPEAAA